MNQQRIGSSGGAGPSNYDETEVAMSGDGGDWVITVDPPLERKNRRGRTTTDIRPASPFNKQLIILIVDDSTSMSWHSKAEFATKTAREVINLCDRKSKQGLACFDIAIYAYGQMIHYSPEHILRPVNEIDPENLQFEGNSGKTDMAIALWCARFLLDTYDEQYYQKHKAPTEVPAPLIFLLSDGYDNPSARNKGFHPPKHYADEIKNMQLPIGLPPMLATVGIEAGQGRETIPHEMLKDLASKSSDGRPAYFEMSDLNLMVELIATTSSSFISSTDDLIDRADEIRKNWENPFGNDPRLEGPE